ncbi:AAA family ATPase [Paenibacillus chibensis]|uniref:AAA family ATPase n=1 Tax=Paenibacillus chibensis TaxID=59846 RepID=A0ABU6PVJ8_9BACL|nr:AAA family ATPase [Paenibacillus chibensis]
MKFIILFGPQAVGKMTVGQELAKITDLKLFHNHMTIELVTPFFSYGSPAGKRLVRLFRQEIFEEMAKSDQEGLIFTFVWAFDLQSDWDYIEEISRIFESRSGTVYYVELEADIAERLERNKNPHRLTHKPTKRNLEFSERDLLVTMENHRLNSREGEIKHAPYMRINNTHLSPEAVARMIKEQFGL